MPRQPKYLTDPKTFNAEYRRLVELKNAAQELNSELSKIVEDLKSSSELPEQVRAYIRYLEGRKSRADNLTRQVLVAQKQAEDLAGKIENKHKEFDELFKKIDSNKATADELIKSAKIADDEIDKLEARITNLAKETRRTLGSAVSGSLSASFARRAVLISGSKWAWLVILTLAAAAAPFIAVYVFKNVDAQQIVGNSLLAGNIFKLATLSPLIFFISYASLQYSRERDLQERYAFKASIAQSLPAYTKLMKDEFIQDGRSSGRENDLIDFAFESIGKIYKEPFVAKQQRRAFIQINRSGAVVNAEEDISGTLDVKTTAHVAAPPTIVDAKVVPTNTKKVA